jgi:hypothetical protein
MCSEIWTLENVSVDHRIRNLEGQSFILGLPFPREELPTAADEFPLTLGRLRSRDSSVGIATSYGLDDRGFGVRVPVGSRIFSSPNRPDRL